MCTHLRGVRKRYLLRCDLELKPVFICYTSLGSGFMHLPEHFLVVVVLFL